MFLLRPHNLIKPRRYQKGNIVLALGLPPTILPPVAGGPGPGWSLIAAYEATDLPSIQASFGNVPCGDSLAWSPDGSRLTLSSSANTQDRIRSFNCSTRFDPATAVSVSAQSEVNPSSGKWNSTGTKFFALRTGNDIYQYGGNNYAIDNGAGFETSFSKVDVGFTGSTDGAFTIDRTGDIILWKGDTGIRQWKSFSVINGDLDNWSEIANTSGAFGMPTVWINSAGLSPILKDNSWVATVGSQGVAFESVSSLLTMASPNRGANQDINSLVPFDFRPDHCWINPADTSEIWFIDEVATGVKMARFATNVDG